VGPDLAEWKRLGKEKMLLSILEPNNEVRKQYETSTILTRDGENLVGLVTDENLATIALRRPNREEIVLPRTNIETIETHPWSLMPEGLQEGLTVQALADLLDYIMVTPR
jgi:putative heme-binding domain-containing protein